MIKRSDPEITVSSPIWVKPNGDPRDRAPFLQRLIAIPKKDGNYN